MIQVHDGLFDKYWVDTLSHILLQEESWHVKNIANRYSFPSGTHGSHRLIGMRIHTKEFAHPNKDLYEGCIEAFNSFNKNIGSNCELDNIHINLQFTGMDGTFHTDGGDNQFSFILMLLNDVLDENIGGEFIHKPSGQSISFKHGRLIQITASDEHKALAFTKPHIPRITVKFVGTIL